MEPIKEPKPLVLLSSSPHMHSSNSIEGAMRDVILALVPAIIAAIYYFRVGAVMVMVSCVVSAVFFEFLAEKVMKKPVTIKDGSAAVTGLLLAMCLPPTFTVGLSIVGAMFAIVLGKMIFGGLGCNIFNPAHLGRAICLSSFPQQMTTWVIPATAMAAKGVDATTFTTDAVSTATPLSIMKMAMQTPEAFKQLPSIMDMFMGNIGGSIGETCVPALIIGGIYLIYKGHIDWRIPVFYLATVTVITGIYGTIMGYPSLFPLYHLFGGGLMIGAFFMATDWVTSPITNKGRIIYAIGLGLLTSLIRLRGSYAEGVCYSILMMNMCTPMIDRFVRKVSFGGGAKK